MIIRIFQYNSDDYSRAIQLRNRILRKPLSMNLIDEDLSGEIKDIHIGAFVSEKMIGILVLTPVDDKIIKMRQVAVDETYRGKGVGTEMVRFAERYSLSKGYKKIIMHARKVSMKFYTKLGYETIGDEFTEVKVPHYKMQKQL